MNVGVFLPSELQDSPSSSLEDSEQNSNIHEQSSTIEEQNSNHTLERTVTIPSPDRHEPKAAESTPQADPRFQPFFAFAYDSYCAKHGNHKPTWGGKDQKQLKNLLRLTSESLEELKQRFTNYIASTDSFISGQGDSLAFFCANFDRFINGPLVGPQRKESFSVKEFARDLAKNSGVIQ
jgi:hypothetical protein